ncbi:hypothetical protein BV22DRAFT_1047415 [Leucogyrophana mollusca]|uniref:Uncharacterized protein n=1 Tax=Leucogyrophana mollusca TaxID=85980 RepID=A0ACB8BIB8_9AGAM|nr:hypothetical protein BV22DRAFT_1047415 [Leucogyrophana mollusca]
MAENRVEGLAFRQNRQNCFTSDQAEAECLGQPGPMRFHATALMIDCERPGSRKAARLRTAPDWFSEDHSNDTPTTFEDLALPYESLFFQDSVWVKYGSAKTIVNRFLLFISHSHHHRSPHGKIQRTSHPQDLRVLKRKEDWLMAQRPQRGPSGHLVSTATDDLTDKDHAEASTISRLGKTLHSFALPIGAGPSYVPSRPDREAEDDRSSDE